MKFEFTGGKALEAKLRALGDPKAARRIGLFALRKAAEPIRDSAKSRVPVDQGNLRESIKIGTAKRGRGLDGDVARVIIAIDRNVQLPTEKGKEGGGSYRDPGVAGVAVIQEFGTLKMAANPFLRPAWDSHKAATPQRIADEMKPALDRAAKRIAARKG